MLERCIATDKARKKRPAESDVFYQKLEILRKMQEETREMLGWTLTLQTTTLNIKPEMHNIALFHDVVFAFEA